MDEGFDPAQWKLQFRNREITLDEIKAAVGDPAPTPGGSGPNFPTFTEVVYQESGKK